MRRSVAFLLIVGGLVVAEFALTRTPVSAQAVPDPCDFITGGGFVLTNDGARANFGAHGGCKNGEFWGHVNYVDHGGFGGQTPYHVDSTQITGYLTVPGFPNARDICGVARDNTGDIVRFRVRMEDNGEGSDATAPDRFGIRLSNFYLVTTRPLADGNVKLHKPNDSTTAPDTLSDCGGLAPPDDGGPPPPVPPD